MFKKYLGISSVLAVGLFSASLAFAENTADIDTVGSGDTAVVEQEGATSDGNLATIDQGLTTPSSDDSNARISQSDSAASSVDNTATITQTGVLNNGEVIQDDGNDNTALIDQNGDGMGAGDENNALITQTGTGNNNTDGSIDFPATITQIGNGNAGEILQTGDSNTETIITQDGNDNAAFLSQSTKFNIGNINQEGGNNVASLTQIDGDGNDADIDQLGDNNQVLVTQGGTGANTADVTQGFNDSSDYATVVLVQLNGATATINQDNAVGANTAFTTGNQAFVAQVGDQMAFVDQTGGNNIAVVNQGDTTSVDAFIDPFATPLADPALTTPPVSPLP